MEIYGSLRYFLCHSRNKSVSPPRVPASDRYGNTRTKMNFEEAFGFGGGRYEGKYAAGDEESGMRLRGTYSEENIHLGPYSPKYGTGDKATASGRLQTGADPYHASRGSPSSGSNGTANSLDALQGAHGRDRSSGVGMAY
jgi:hypothetical protein